VFRFFDASNHKKNWWGSAYNSNGNYFGKRSVKFRSTAEFLPKAATNEDPFLSETIQLEKKIAAPEKPVETTI
jgi:hypothetical protein